MSDDNQKTLFEMPSVWEDIWRGMPSYKHKDLESASSIQVHFRNLEDRWRFAELLGQKIGPQQLSAWYPKAEIATYADKRYDAINPSNPKYPVYIISKGRWDSRRTSKALELLGIPYAIVVEPQEYDNYARVIDYRKIISLPFSNLGQGSVPARNFVWDHASARAARHWILDDNISGFYRFEDNLKCPVGDGTIFRAIEEFSDRYDNIALSGMNYFMFVKRKLGTIPPVTLNTRIYSCILINNSINYRWRGRYNEDTDLSIRVLKDGLCTVLFNAFLADKEATMRMKGGNTDELYAGDGRLKMAESLRDQHPDVVTIVTKFKRAQHQVNYAPFARNKLIPRDGVAVDEKFGKCALELAFWKCHNRDGIAGFASVNADRDGISGGPRWVHGRREGDPRG